MKSNLKLVESAVELPIPKLSRSTNEQIAEKKKRGRPRIMPVAIIEEPPKIEPIPIIEPQAVILEKKKRGRPRKLVI